MLVRALVLLAILLASCQMVSAPQSRVDQDLLAKAQAGDRVAQNEMARFYHYGQAPGQENYVAAFEWYLKAAQQGVNEAQANVAYLYAEGQGTAQDLSKAWFWYAVAAVENKLLLKQRDEIAAKLSPGELALAQNDLARFYHYGQSPGQENYTAAFEWYLAAARQGVNEAQANVAYLYAEGQGTTRDLGKAWVWYSIAATGNNQLAARHRDEIAAKLSKKELAQAKLELGALRKQLGQ